MKTRDYWSFDHIDQLTEKQKKFVDNFVNSRQNLIANKLNPRGIEVKRRCIRCGASMSQYKYTRACCDGCKYKRDINQKIDSNAYVKISPEEIDRQYKQAMEQMKRDKDLLKARETSLEVEASLSHGR